jgi:hypothetical protein
MERELRFGRMGQNMREIGETVWLKDKEYSIILMEIFIQGNFYKIKQMDLEFIFIKMVKNMKDSGRMISKMVLEKKNLKMVLSMKVYLKMEKNGEKVITNGLMAQHFQDSG